VNDLNKQSVRLYHESISIDIADVIKDMLASNLKVWALMNETK